MVAASLPILTCSGGPEYSTPRRSHTQISREIFFTAAFLLHPARRLPHAELVQQFRAAVAVSASCDNHTLLCCYPKL